MKHGAGFQALEVPEPRVRLAQRGLRALRVLERQTAERALDDIPHALFAAVLDVGHDRGASVELRSDDVQIAPRRSEVDAIDLNDAARDFAEHRAPAFLPEHRDRRELRLAVAHTV